MTIRWYGLVAPEEAPTGDRRMLERDMLTYRRFPLYAAWQEVSGGGHSGSVVVGSWDQQYQGIGGVWASGEFLDPTIIPQVTRAVYLLEKKLIGPSIDLDPDFAYEVVPHPDRPDEFAMKVTRGNIHGVTFVMGPAFPQVHITVDTEEEMTVLASAGITTAVFASSGVNASAWRKFPLAPDRATTFDHDSAVDRIAAWSGGDAGKFASAFLWKDPEGNALNRETYRLPVIDILDGKPYLIPRAVFSAGVIMSGGHGGLYDTLSEPDRLKVQEVITDIYDMLRDTYADPRVIAPWQRGGRQGARNEADSPTRVASIDLNHWTQHESTDKFKEAMDYANRCFPRTEEFQMIIDLATASEEFQSRLGGELEEYWVRGEGAGKIRWGTEGSFDRCVKALAKHFPQDTEGLCANLHHEATGKWPAEGKRRGEHSLSDVVVDPGAPDLGDDVVTAAGVLKPDRGWFADPKLPRATPLHVDENGRVFGHLATWKQCHMGVGNRCVMAPQSRANYKWFKNGSVLCADGSALRVGKLTLGTGHADKSYGVVPAIEHYDHTGLTVAVVNAGEDSFGVWVAGALVQGVTEAQAAELRRSPLSGDWRRVDGNLELVAALAVNSPGFPVLHEDVDGSYSLTAAGVLDQDGGADQPGLPVLEGGPSTVGLDAVDSFLTDMARADRAESIGRAFHDLLPPQEGCGCN
jgi:hypothetical protein